MTDSVVTEELGLSKDQQEQVRSIQLKAIQQLNAVPPADREKQFFRLQNEAMNSIIALLSSEQRQRLDKMKGEPFDVEALLRSSGTKATINGTIRGWHHGRCYAIDVGRYYTDDTLDAEFRRRKGPTLHLSQGGCIAPCN